MSFRKTHEEFIHQMDAINNDVIIKSIYQSSKHKISCQCRKCGFEWESLPGNLLQGKGCRRCAGKYQKTHDEFIAELKVKNPNVIALEKYVYADQKIKFQCKVCKYEWEQMPTVLLKGHGCARCAGNLKKSHEQFVQELDMLEHNIRVIGKYSSMNKHIQCECEICGHIWDAIPSQLLRGVGCPKCVHTSTSFPEQFICEFFRRVLGNTEIINRDKSAIGMELDIYLPNYKMGIEFGGWYWHKDKFDSDEQKRIKCIEKGIRLINIYEGFPENAVPPFRSDCWCFSKYLSSEKDYGILKQIAMDLLALLSKSEIDHSINWEEIINNSYALSRRKNQEEFLEEIYKTNPKIEILEDFQSVSKKIRTRCKICGYEWTPFVSGLLRGNGCPNCAGMVRKTQDQFIAEMEKVNPNIQILGEYINSHTKVECHCKKCNHIWNASPSKLRIGKGCPKCGRKSAADKIRNSESQFLDRLSKVNPNIEVLGQYVGADTKIECKCKKCGNIWMVTPSNLYAGKGCPPCNKGRKKKNVNS